MDVPTTSQYIPTLAMKLYHAGGRLQNALPVDLLPQEKPDDKIGLGIFPLLESVGSGTTKFPTHDAIAVELNNLLRRQHPTNNVNLGRLNHMLQDDVLPSSTTGTVRFDWPEFVPEEAGAEARAGGPQRVSGLCL